MTTPSDRTEELLPRYIRANGMEFAYLEPAASPPDGPLVLCLHGFPDTAYSMTSLLHALVAAGFRAVAPFQRGYPPGELPEDRDYSAAALGRDVIALVEHFGVSKASVVGHDWGAVAAYAAAALRPDRISRIVAASVPHPRRFLLRPSRAQLRASHYMFKFQLPGWGERRIPKNDFAWLVALVKSWSPGWSTPPDAYLKPVKAAFSDPARLKAALGYYRAIPKLLLTKESWQFLLQPIQVPARVIHGADDGCILPKSFSESEHLFASDYDLVALPGAGHFVQLEVPAAFEASVLEFLKRG
jgi:pimeloyl-ACP methyl ester carboxylesterase